MMERLRVGIVLGCLVCAAVIPAARIGPRPTLDWDACITDSAAANRFRDEYLKAFLADQPRYN